MPHQQFCRKCNVRLPQDSQFCPACGTSQQTTEQFTMHTPPQPVDRQADMGTGRLPAGQTLHNRYRLLERVGQGGMGAVYVAQDTQLGDRLVAVKEMSISRLPQQDIPQAVEQFKREAHLLASLHHVNLPAIHDHFQDGSRWYLVMSFIQGDTLYALLNAQAGKKLPINEVVRIGIELCNVLDYLHNHQPQIVFRDLKPLNIMITPQGQVFLIDFGIARHFKMDQSKDTTYYYSVGYAPPEQYGQSQTGPRSDIYSLGATLHQMLSGHNPSRRPFYFPNLQLLDPQIPLSLAKLIAQMLEMSEQERPSTAALVKAALQKVLYPPKMPETQLIDEKRNMPARPEPKRPTRAQMLSMLADPDDLTWKQVWMNFIAFLKKGSIHVVLWLCFILICATFSVFALVQIDLTRNDATYLLVDISGIGATLVGLVLLAAKGQRLISMIGGILLTILSILVTIRFFDYSLLDLLSNDGSSHTFIFHEAYQTHISLLVPFSYFLLAIGTGSLIRQATTLTKVLFGAFLLGTGIILDNVASRLNLDSHLHNLAQPVWQIQAIAGGALLGLTLLLLVFKITRNSFTRR